MNDVNKNILDFLYFGSCLQSDDDIFGLKDLDLLNEVTDEEELVSIFTKRFNDYFADNLYTHDNVGVLLSGGIDSANLLSFLKKDNKKILAYTWGGWGEKTTDVIYSKYTVKKFGVDKHSIILKDDNYKKEEDMFIDLIKKIKIPLNFRTAIPYIFMKKEILNDNIKIVLNGQNADTLFMSYMAPVKAFKILRKTSDLLLNPILLMACFKSSGLWKYVKFNKKYLKELYDIYQPISKLKISLQRKIILCEEIYTEARYCQNHQKKILEYDTNIKVLNPYYDKQFINYCLSASDEIRGKDNFNKSPLYVFARKNGVPAEVINKPKKGLSYGYKDFLEKKMHLPIWKEIMEDRFLNQFVNTNKAYNKAKNNFDVFDRLRSIHFFIKYVLNE